MYHSPPLLPRSSSGLRTAKSTLHSNIQGEDEMFRNIRIQITSRRGIAATLALILALGLGLSVTAPATKKAIASRTLPRATLLPHTQQFNITSSSEYLGSWRGRKGRAVSNLGRAPAKRPSSCHKNWPKK